MPKSLNQFIKRHQTIGLDSMIYIYHFEEASGFSDQTKKIFRLLENGNFSGISSVISMIEILTQPKKKRIFYLVKEYQHLIRNFPNLEIKDVNFKVADLASSLRAEYNLTTPDAIVVSTCLVSGATGLITSDVKLSKVKEIDMFILDNQ